MKKGLIFLVIVACFLFGQVVYAGEKEREWDVIKIISHKNTTYSLVQNNQTDELYFLKEEKEKGNKREVYRSLVGTYENRIKAGIHLKKRGIILFISSQNDFSFLRVEDTSGEITNKVQLPLKKKSSKSKKSEKPRVSKKESLTSKRLVLKSQQELNTDDPPEPPSFYTVENITPTSVRLKWTEVEGVDEYRVYLNPPFEDEGVRELVAETDSTSLEIDSLEPGELYIFYLRAVRDGVESEEIYTAVLTPDYFEEIEIQSATTWISLEWSPVERASGYQIELIDGEGWKGPKQLEETQYTYDDLKPQTLYAVLLEAMDGNASFDQAIVVYTTPALDSSDNDDEVPDFPDPPAPTGDLPAPTDFTVEPEQTNAQLQWNPVEDAEAYVLWINGERMIEVGDVTSYELTGLTPYTPYELHLRAIDEDGRDGESSVQSFFTWPDHLDPPDVKVDRVTSVGAYLTWEPVKAARTYTIAYNGTSKQLEDENVKVTGLREQQRYVFTITAEHGGVKSDPVEVEVETIPFSYQSDYDGSLLDSVMDSYEQQWDYQYDKNGNVLKIKYSPVPKSEKQEFDIRGQ